MTTTVTIEHTDFCGQQHAPYATSSCEAGCEYLAASIAECVEVGEHLRRIVSDNGYDICANCGARA